MLLLLGELVLSDAHLRRNGNWSCDFDSEIGQREMPNPVRVEAMAQKCCGNGPLIILINLLYSSIKHLTIQFVTIQVGNAHMRPIFKQHGKWVIFPLSIPANGATRSWPPWPWSVAAADLPCALLWCVATCTFAECPWAMTPKKKATQAVPRRRADVVGFWNFWIANSHDRKTMTASHFCEQHGDFTAFLADLQNQKFAQQKLKKSGQKAWRSFWKPTLPAPMYPYLMMGLDLSGTSAACRSRGFCWECCHDVQLLSVVQG